MSWRALIVVPLVTLLIGCVADDAPSIRVDHGGSNSAGSQQVAGIDYSQYPDKHFIRVHPPLRSFAFPQGVCFVTDSEKRTVVEDGVEIEETIYYYGEKIDQALIKEVTAEELTDIVYYDKHIVDSVDFSQDVQPRRTEVSVCNYSTEVIPQIDFTYNFLNKDGKCYRFIARRTMFANRDWGLCGSLLPLSAADNMPGPLLMWPHHEWYASTDQSWDQLKVYHWRKPLPVTDVQTLIPEMIRQEKIEDVTTLMEKHPEYWNLKPTHGGGTTPQMVAFVLGDKSLNDLAYKNGATMAMQNNYGQGIMHFAARSWDKTTIDRLVAKGGDVHSVDLDGNTPLHVASMMLIMENLDALLKHNADPNAVSKYGHTPTTMAIRVGQPPLVERLVQAGGRIDNLYNKDGDPLIVALGGNMAIIKPLLDMGYPMEQRSVRTGGTVLIEAARYGRFDLVGELLDRGADRNAKDDNGADFLEAAKESTTLHTNRHLLEYLEGRKKPKK